MVMMAYVGPAGLKFSTCGWLSLMSPSHLEPPARSSWVEYHVNCSCSTPFYLQTGRIASLFLGLKWLPVSSSFPYLTKSVSILSPAGGFPGLSAYHALLICSYQEWGYSFLFLGKMSWLHCCLDAFSVYGIKYSIRFCIAALANHHNLVALKNRNAFSYTSGAWNLDSYGAQSRCGRGSLPREGRLFPCLFQLLVAAGISSLWPLCSNSAPFVSWPSHLLFGLQSNRPQPLIL